VIDRNEEDGRAWKCTLCYDRLGNDMTPACAKACPTESIQFGDIDELRARAHDRVRELHDAGVTEAYLYGENEADQPGTDGLNAFFLLVDQPEVYNLPPDPVAPRKTVGRSWRSMIAASVALAVTAAVSVMGRRG
jgi:formate dehydrogenase iron-sulfur subunit